MALSNTDFSEENPFKNIKVRHLFLWIVLITFGLVFQLLTFGAAIGSDSKEPFFGEPILAQLTTVYLVILTVIWLLRQCQLSGINVKQLIGKVETNYQWLPIIGIVIARIIFSMGAFRVCSYPLSFIAPSFIESILTNSLSLEASKSFAPFLYYLVILLYSLLISPIAEGFLLHGIALHRLATKWGNRSAILALCLFYGTFSPNNFLGGLSLGLIYTLLYIKTRRLFVVAMARILNNAISLILNIILTAHTSTATVSLLEQFRAQWRIGVFYLAVSTPWLVYFVYKNWPRQNTVLPYFANTSQ